MLEPVPPEVQRYLEELTGRLSGALADSLLGVYVGGSLALGGYQQGTSDIDVAAVVRHAVPASSKARVIEGLRHRSLPCPARGVEFVLYWQPELRRRPEQPGFELELNDGAHMPFAAHTRSDQRSVDAGDFWYGLDIAILHQSGVAVHGPPASDVFPPVPRAEVLALLDRSLDWHLRQASTAGANARANALRSLYFVRHGWWVSKQTAVAELGTAPLDDDDLLARVRREVVDAARRPAT